MKKANDIFVDSGPVDCDSPAYISRQTDEEAFQTVLRKKYLSIVAPRQMGKTSLLQKMQQVLEREKGYAVVYLDLSTFKRSIR